MGYQYQIGSIVFDHWTIARKIGAGSFGTVYEIQREDFGKVYRAALKVIRVPDSQDEVRAELASGLTEAQVGKYFYSVVEEIVHEFAIMAELKGTSNIVSYEDHEIIEHRDGIGWDILIRMELLTPMAEYAARSPMTRRDVILLGIGMCRALERCQKYNVIHRDIKIENIFVSADGEYKLGDFGIARTIEETHANRSKKGTYSYMAPEVYKNEPYGYNVDIYSLGIVLYRLLNRGRGPFEAEGEVTQRTREAALNRRMSGESLPRPAYSADRLSEIVLKACAYKPEDRYSSPGQMRQELEAILYDESDASLIYPNQSDAISGWERSRESSKSEKDGTTPDARPQYWTEPGTRTQKDGEPSGKLEPSGKNNEGAGGTVKDGGERDSVAVPRSHDNALPPTNVRTKPVQNTKRKTVIIGMVAAIIVCVGAGLFIFNHIQQQRAAQEAARLAEFQQLMNDGMSMTATEPSRAGEMFLEAQKLYPDNAESYSAYAYALYMSGEYQACVDYIEGDLSLGENYDVETQHTLDELLGAAYFEMDDYAAAAGYFRHSVDNGDMTDEAMRDYAVSLGRLGDIDAADEILKKMFSAGANEDVTTYVQGEIDYAKQDYSAAEQCFQDVLDKTENELLIRRAVRSLAEVYRDCSALVRAGKSPISSPATKEIDLLTNQVGEKGVRYDAVLWEMLGLAYFEAYHTDPSVPARYLQNAADCFEEVLESGIQRDYLFGNLYSIYYEMGNYDAAEQALKDYETAFPNDYIPHALRAIMLISIENNKPQASRNYSAVLSEYQIAGSLMRSSDDATNYQQLEALINDLKAKGWV